MSTQPAMVCLVLAMAAGTAAAAASTTPRFAKLDPAHLRVSSFSGGRVLEAIDGLPNSRWDSGKPQSGDEWYQVELPGEGLLHKLELRTDASPNDYPRRLRVSVSRDGATFFPVADVPGRPPATEVLLDPPQRCRVVRLEQTGRDPFFWWAIHELSLWSDVPPPKPTLLSRVKYPRALAVLLASLTMLAAAVALARRLPARPVERVEGEEEVVARRWRRLALFTCAAFGIVLVATQARYGETWDEFEHFENGQEYFEYLTGRIEIPAMVYGHEFRKYYAPFSDILATFVRHGLHDRLGWATPEVALHLHLNLLYVASGLVLFLVIASFAGGRAAYLSLAAYFLFPRLLGDSHSNMKDFAVTAWMVMATFVFFTAAARRSYLLLAVAGLLTGMATATKLTGLLLVPCFGAYLVLSLLWLDRRDEPLRRSLLFGAAGFGAIYLTIAFGSAILFWPWTWADPVGRFLETVRFFQHHIWKGLVLYKGEMVRADLVPRDYAPYYLLITTPVGWLPFFVAGLLRTAWDFVQQRGLLTLVAGGFATPVAVEVLTDVSIYDGIRHFLPALPFMACLIGAGMDAAIRLAGNHRPLRALAVGAIAAAFGATAFYNVRMHPYQVTYFNALVGGGRGAAGTFELDYWGSSLKEAGAWVNRDAPPGSRVHVLLELQRLARLRPDLQLTMIDADYAIVLVRESLAVDPYAGQTPAYTVQADGAVLARVYKFGEGAWRHAAPLAPVRAAVKTAPGLRRLASEPGTTLDGYVKIPEPGLYSFLISADQSTRLFLGGELMFESRPTPQLFERVVRATLEPGLYRLRVESPSSTLSLRWRRPGQYAYEEIPAESLAHPAAPGEVSS